MRLRHQLPAHSPVPARALLRAVRALAHAGADRDAVEGLLRDRYAATQVTLCGSGTEALQLALQVAMRRVARGSRAPVVALPAYGCFDLATAAVGARARVLLYDLDPRTLAPDEASLERVLASGAAVVVATPLYGVPLPWEAIHAQTSRHGAVLIEDAAQGHGASWKGRPLGSFGVLSVLSFGRGKGWTAGRGGALLARGGWSVPVRRGRAAPRGSGCVVGLAGHWALGRPAIYGIPRSMPSLALGETTYHAPTRPGAMPGCAMAALLATLDAASDEAEHRRCTGQLFAQALEHRTSVVTTTVPDGGRAGWLRFPVRLPNGLASLAEQDAALRLGIAPGYPRVLGELDVLRERQAGGEARWAGASALVRELVTLPTHSLIGPDERAEIVRMMADGTR